VIPLARRFSPAALALLAIAALTIWLPRGIGARADSCSGSELQHLAAYGENYTTPEMGELESSIHDLWVDGRLPPFAGTRPLFFRVVRTVDPFRFYDLHRYFIQAPPLPADFHEIRALSAGSDVLPVHHRIDAYFGPHKHTQYLFALGLEPVAHPFRAGLSHALDQLVRGRRPIALFMVSGTVNEETRAAFEQHANAWMAEAWSEYRRVCESG
jgi:hypothetical protein